MRPNRFAPVYEGHRCRRRRPPQGSSQRNGPRHEQDRCPTRKRGAQRQQGSCYPSSDAEPQRFETCELSSARGRGDAAGREAESKAAPGTTPRTFCGLLDTCTSGRRPLMRRSASSPRPWRYASLALREAQHRIPKVITKRAPSRGSIIG